MRGTFLPNICGNVGFVVDEAADGDEAKAALVSGQLVVRIAFADVTTAASGFALQTWIRTQMPDVEVILAGLIDKAVDRAGSLSNDGPALAKPYEDHFSLIVSVSPFPGARNAETGYHL